MFYYVYILQSLTNYTLYIGCTDNLKRRIKEHNSGFSYHTQKYMPWKLIYFEGYRSKKDAFLREKSLKRNAQGLRRLKERLNHSLLRELCEG